MSRPLLLEHATPPTASSGMDTGMRSDLAMTAGFMVADARGRVVGRVEGPMYGASPEQPDALSVRVGVLRRRRRLVPADAIAAIDDRTQVIGLLVDRAAVRAFL